mmetsp:Transcript_25838/g.43085  ORF Transcript_25838/g.43085 Transcript_25838/m.43085 type:complete len:253 (-) Transcript_25838:377-1135(-)
MGDNASSDTGDERFQRIIKVRMLVRERDEAKKSADFVKADALREQLDKEHQVKLFDQVGGPTGWKFKDGSSKVLPSSYTVPPEAKRKRDDTISKDSAVSGEETNPGKRKKMKKVKKNSTSDAETSRNSALMKSVLGTTNNKGTGKNVQGVLIEELKVGSGKVARSGSKIKVHYVGKLKTTGKMFDACTKRPFSFRLGAGEVIRGWDIGCEGMCVGGKRRLTIPPEKAYGQRGAPPAIPGNATLVFEVSLIDC